MQRLSALIGLVIIAALFVGMEIVLKPDIWENTTPMAASQFQFGEEKTNAIAAPEEMRNNTSAISPVNHFNMAKLTEGNILLDRGDTPLTLFETEISPSQDDFFLASFIFTLQDKEVGKITRIVPSNTMSAGRLMSVVREKIKQDISENEQFSLSEPLNTIGEANFYFNNQEEPDSVFLVTRDEAKVLAIEYPKEYHDSVKKIIPLFF